MLDQEKMLKNVCQCRVVPVPFNRFVSDSVKLAKRISGADRVSVQVWRLG